MCKVKHVDNSSDNKENLTTVLTWLEFREQSDFTFVKGSGTVCMEFELSFENE